VMYIERFQDPSSRTMKQVSSTLVKLLLKHSELLGTESPWSVEAATGCLSHIYATEDLSCVKPSMLLLDILISKQMIGANELVSLLPSRNEIVEDTPITEIKDFVSNVLRWARHLDISLAAGRLVGTFFARVNELIGETKDKPPIWWGSILEIADDGDAMIEILENYILPSLLQANPIGTLQVLNSLPIDKLIGNNIGSITEREIRFCLLLIEIIGKPKTNAEYGNVDKAGYTYKLTHPETSVESMTGYTPLRLREAIVSSCLKHSSCTIRSTAAGLIINSSIASQYFSQDNLIALREVIPSFFAESDTKERGEALTVIKKLFSRLTIIMPRLKKLLQFPPLPSQQSVMTDVSHEETAMRKAHDEFLYWFRNFVYTELQSSASYQRHIMSLKAISLSSVREVYSKWSKVIDKINFQVHTNTYSDSTIQHADVNTAS
jgi:hypothetical protein